MPCILCGVEDWVEEVEDVYDGHHVMEKPTTTTETKTVPKTTKKSTATAVHHGDTQPSPLYLYPKLTKSIFGTNDILQVFEYQHKTKMLEFNPIQCHPLRHSFLDILGFDLKQWHQGKIQLNDHFPTIVTLLFKKKLKKSQRKYLKVPHVLP